MHNIGWIPAKTIFLFVMLTLFSSCITTFGEKHYFQAVDKEGNVSNYFRLKVEGYASFSSARYVSGYYDERAVDMFFNEMKVSPTPAEATSVGTIFKDNQVSPGTEQKITPLNSPDEHGAFLMILSTNASSVTKTIGQFAENQIVAEAVTNLANRDLIRSKMKSSEAFVSATNATADELEDLFELIPNNDAPDPAETQRSFLRILNAIAQSMDSEQEQFKTFAEAEEWYSSIKKEF